MNTWILALKFPSSNLCFTVTFADTNDEREYYLLIKLPNPACKHVYYLQGLKEAHKQHKILGGNGEAKKCSMWPEDGSYQSSVSNKDLLLDQEEQRGNRITLIFVKIVYKKIHTSDVLPLLRVSFKFTLACSMLKCPDGVWKQQSRLQIHHCNLRWRDLL